MVYKYETDECEIPFVDWTHRAFTPIPKATISDGGSGSSASGDVNVTVSCDCDDTPGRSVTPTPTPTPTEEEPKSEETPKEDEPKEEPKTEEPVKDEPKEDDPVKEPEEQPKEETPTEEPKQEDTPKEEEPKPEDEPKVEPEPVTPDPVPEEPKDPEPVWAEDGTTMNVTPLYQDTTSVMTKDYQDVAQGEVKDKQTKDTVLSTRDTNNKFLKDKGLLRTTTVERTDGSYDVDMAVGGYTLNKRKAMFTLSKSDIINKIIPQDKVTMVHGKFFDLKINPTDGFFTIFGTSDTEQFVHTGDDYHTFEENPEFYEHFVFHVKGE